jgi:hypothetical protein
LRQLKYDFLSTACIFLCFAVLLLHSRYLTCWYHLNNSGYESLICVYPTTMCPAEPPQFGVVLQILINYPQRQKPYLGRVYLNGYAIIEFYESFP